MLTPEERDEVVSELVSRPGHERSRTLLHRLLVDVLGCRHLALFLNIPLLSFMQIDRSLCRIAEEVMPRVAMPAPRGGSEAELAGAEMPP